MNSRIWMFESRSEDASKARERMREVRRKKKQQGKKQARPVPDTTFKATETRATKGFPYKI